MSTRGRYGLRAMLDLARHYGERPVLMSDVAEREDLSRKYLHTLLSGLKSAGLVRSVRGAGGGFALTRPPAEITLDQIVRAAEGSLALVPCVNDENLCRKSGACTARRIWQRVSAAAESVLQGLTLHDMLIMDDETCFTASAKSKRRSRTGGASADAPRATPATRRRRRSREGKTAQGSKL